MVMDIIRYTLCDFLAGPAVTDCHTPLNGRIHLMGWRPSNTATFFRVRRRVMPRLIERTPSHRRRVRGNHLMPRSLLLPRPLHRDWRSSPYCSCRNLSEVGDAGARLWSHAMALAHRPAPGRSPPQTTRRKRDISRCSPRAWPW